MVTGIAAALVARDGESLAFMLDAAARGEICAFGNAEGGNDLVNVDLRTCAEHDRDVPFFGGTRIALLGHDVTDPAWAPRVHAVVDPGDESAQATVVNAWLGPLQRD